MREYIVEVPALVRVAVDAEDVEAAARTAGKIVDGLTFEERLERVGGIWQLVRPEIVPLDEEGDAEADVYLCSGGELMLVNSEDGRRYGTGEECGSPG